MFAASAAILGALVASGLALGGYFIEQGFLSARGRDRFVTVRGLVERPVSGGCRRVEYRIHGDQR